MIRGQNNSQSVTSLVGQLMEWIIHGVVSASLVNLQRSWLKVWQKNGIQ